MPYRLAIFETHPIQYKVPWFRALAAHPDVDLTVFYCMVPDARQQGAGFGVDFQWDIPLLEGYRYVVLGNVAEDPGVTHFSGCDTPSIADYIAGRDGETLPTHHTDHMEVESAHESTRMDTNGEGKREFYGKNGGNGKRGERYVSTSVDVASVAPGSQTPCSRLPAPCTVPPPSVRAFDAVIINGWVVKGCLQALWACRRAGIPAILRCEACDLQPRAWWKTLIHRALLRQFSAFMAIGVANRQFYLRRGVQAERIVDGFYCIENERFQRAAQEARDERDGCRRRWGIPPEAVCFLFCGKFEPKKRPLDLLRALTVLNGRALGAGSAEGGPGTPPTEHTEDTEREGKDDRTTARQDLGPLTSDLRSPPSVSSSGLRTPDSRLPGAARPVHLLMVGDGELRGQCETYAREHRLPVTFTGFLNQGEMPQAYAAADCLVLPSDHGETWGLVVNEAMACGLPALVSDRVGCHPDLILPGRTGQTFPCGDVPALAGLMRRFAVTPDALRLMGARAREHIRGYSIAALVDGTMAALRAVAGRPRDDGRPG